MDVAVTGANGTVGTAIYDHLADDPRYEFHWVDVATHPDHETVVADMCDFEALRDAFAGQDAVVHLAHAPGLTFADKTVSWSDGMAQNLRGTVNAYAAALEAGVESIVFASTNHVVGLYERDLGRGIYDPDEGRVLDADVPVRPDSPYGAVKVFGEALGRYCAEWYDTACYAIRLGAVMDSEHDAPEELPTPDPADFGFEPGSEAERRAALHFRSLWCSRRDCAQLVARCLDDDSVTFDVFHGVSANANRWLDLEHARAVLGYDPQDGADAAPIDG
jgi:nucleoside-diphosphate-sugar epimerase